jgi:hypothetical protein
VHLVAAEGRSPPRQHARQNPQHQCNKQENFEGRLGHSISPKVSYTGRQMRGIKEVPVQIFPSDDPLDVQKAMVHFNKRRKHGCSTRWSSAGRGNA